MNSSSVNFSDWEYQVIALAGVAQSAALVHGLATYGTIPERELNASTNSLLVLAPDSVADVYPNVGSLGLGLQSVQSVFSKERVRDNAELIRYLLGMLVLCNKLMANSLMQQEIREGLKHIPQLPNALQTEADGVDCSQQELLKEQIFEQLASLYQDTISKLSYRIQVQGKIEHLKNKQSANRIRALLLAGIRSAVLWQQLGGRRWRLIFYRKKVQLTAGDIRRKLIVSI